MGSKTFKTKIVNTPLQIQMENVECGAVCLGMILGYYKNFVSFEELRSVCDVSRDGSSAKNIVHAAEQYNLEVNAYSLELEDLKDIKPPYIIFWDFNHFVVVEGFTKKFVQINDPAMGRRKLSYSEFDKSFTGVVLELSPGKGFTKSGKPEAILPALLSRLKHSYGVLCYLFIISLVLVIPGIAVPIFTKIFVDDYLIANVTSWIQPLLIGMLITALTRSFLTWLQSYSLLKLENKMAISQSSKFFWHVLRLPSRFFSQRSTGDIINRIDLNNDIAALLANQAPSSIVSFLLIIAFGIVMLFYNPFLALIAFASSVLQIFILKFFHEYRKNNSLKLVSFSGKFMGSSMNGLKLMETLKSSGREQDFYSTWSGHQANLISTRQSVASNNVLIEIFDATLDSLTSILILTLGAWFILTSDMSIGMLVAFQSLAASFVGYFSSFVGTVAGIQDVYGDIAKLDDVMKNAEDDVYKNENTDKQLKLYSGNLELKDVTFGYSESRAPLLENFNLQVAPGERIALIGTSGCGKSTIAKLLMRLYHPWSGQILLDGEPIESINRTAYLNTVSMVAQDFFIFDGTIKQNLTMWKESIPEEVIIQAAKDACIHDDISMRLHGYNEHIEEGGGNFSGGQRQRLEIARALINQPRILIMDEATSALDPVIEYEIDSNIRKRGCACIIVAHRLSTIRDCDQIIVLDHGKIMQHGKHAELIQEPGIYQRLMRE